MSVLACAIPTMRISMVELGRVVSNVAISGRHEITNGCSSSSLKPVD
jgi:hypothetical protein